MISGPKAKAIIFDVGGVLCADALGPKRRDLAAKYGKSSSEFARAGRELRSNVDEGRMTEAEYWTAVLASVGVSADEEDATVAPYVRIFAGIPKLLRSVWEAGFVLACLTNDSLELASARQQALAAALGTTTVGRPPRASLFTHITVSAAVGVQKPAAAIYDYTVDTLGLRPDDCLFVDDKPENLRAAEVRGMRTVQFSSVRQLAAEFDITLSGASSSPS